MAMGIRGGRWKPLLNTRVFRGWAGRPQDGGEGLCRVCELVSGGKQLGEAPGKTPHYPRRLPDHFPSSLVTISSSRTTLERGVLHVPDSPGRSGFLGTRNPGGSERRGWLPGELVGLRVRTGAALDVVVQESCGGVAK